jgi:signal transduction histidine kinase
VGAVEALTAVARRVLGVPVVLVGVSPDELELSVSGPADRPDSRISALFGRDSELTGILSSAVQQAGTPLIVEDTRAHPLLQRTPTVRGHRVLAVLAVPLRDESGRVSGALSALDGIPRWWTDSDVQLLESLSTAVSALLAPAVLSERATSRGSQKDRSSGALATDVLAALPDGVLVLDTRWQVSWCNAAMARWLALSPDALVGQDARVALGALVDSAVLASWHRAVETQSPTNSTWHNQASDRWFDARASVMGAGLIVTLRDISVARHADAVRTRREAQAREGKKLDAIGLLAGGVAHDFNNLLTVIAANAELMLLTPFANEAQTEIDEVRRAAARATELTRKLLAFSRQQLLDPQLISLHSVLAAVMPKVVRALPESIAIETSLATEPVVVHADASQLEEVVMQLALNARDSMTDGGVMRFSTGVSTLTAPLPARPMAVPPGTWVTLTVRDTGHGISPQLIDRVFEPFFTTRDVGAGMGLGLATVYGIVAQSGGVCTVQSDVGCGASFRVWLPAVQA